MQFTLDGAIGGNFTLSIYRVDPATLQVTYNVAVTLNYNASEIEFCNQIRAFDLYNKANALCEVKRYNEQGALIDSGVGAVKSVWTVQVRVIRWDSHKAEKFTFKGDNLVPQPNKTPSFQENRLQDFSPLISGTFTMEIGGTSISVYNSATKTYSVTDIPFNVKALDLQNGIRQFVGFEKTEVTTLGDCAWGCTWLINFAGYNDPVPQIFVSASGLRGGSSSSSPQIVSQKVLEYSSAIVFSPVDSSFLRQPADSPSIHVTVNSLLSVCLNDCSYTFLENVPEVTSQSLSGNVLNLVISNPESLTISNDEITVFLGDQ